MKINWKVRFRSPVFVVTFFTMVLSFIYNVLGMLEIVPPITEEAATNVLIAAVQLMSTLGILNDPTSAGLCDCKNVLALKQPLRDTD